MFEAPGRTASCAPGANPFALAGQTAQAVLLWSYAAPLWIAMLSLGHR